MRRLAGRWRVVRELLGLLWEQRLLWMIPLVLVLLLLGALLIVGQQSAIAPFIYTIF